MPKERPMNVDDFLIQSVMGKMKEMESVIYDHVQEKKKLLEEISKKKTGLESMEKQLTEIEELIVVNKESKSSLYEKLEELKKISKT